MTALRTLITHYKITIFTPISDRLPATLSALCEGFVRGRVRERLSGRAGAHAMAYICCDVIDGVEVFGRQIGLRYLKAVGIFDEKHQFENPSLIENAIFQQRVIITKIENGAIIEKVCADELDDLHFYKGLAQRAGVLICHLLAPLSRLSCVSRRR